MAIEAEEPGLGHHSSCGADARAYHRKVDVRLGDAVQVVGEDIERRDSNDFDDFAVAEAGLARCGDLSVTRVAAAFKQALGEANGGVGLEIRRPALPRPRDVGLTEAGALAEEGVGRQAIVATVGLGDRKRDLCYEPFSGSGSQIIAGETMGRRVYAIEISPQYVDVAVRRWQTASGRTAMLDADGRSFDEIAGERLPQAA
jgi:hypothetical protein